MGQQEIPSYKQVLAMLACAAMVVLLGGGFVWLVVSIARSPPYRGPQYTVSITGVDGLNQEATSGGALSPVFNITVRIENPDSVWNSPGLRDDACVWALSTAVVSYGDAFLGKGSVPPFCAKDYEVQERMVTAWGEDVVLPRFLRERLSGELERGEASLDVQVIMPAEEACFRCSDKVLVCSKVKIGGGGSSPSLCRVERVRPLPAAGSTSTI